MKTWQRSLAIGLWVIGIPALWSGWKAYSEAQQRQHNAATIKRLEDAMERYQNQKQYQNTGPAQDQTSAPVTPSTNDTEEQPQQEQTHPEPAQAENAQAATAQTTAQRRASEFFPKPTQ